MTVNKHYRKQLCDAFKQRANQQEQEQQQQQHMHHHHPLLTALNSGLLVGTVGGLRRLSRRFLAAAPVYASAVRSPVAYSDLQRKMASAMGAADDGDHRTSMTTNAAAAVATDEVDDGGDEEDDDEEDDLSRAAALRMSYRHALVASSSSSSSSSSLSVAVNDNPNEHGRRQPRRRVSGLPFLVNDQSVYYLMLAVDDPSSHGVALDVSSRLFLSMYGTPNRLSLAIDRRQSRFRQRNNALVIKRGGPPKATKTTMAAATAAKTMKMMASPPNSEGRVEEDDGSVAPAFVHYNGGSKLPTWNPSVGRRALSEALLERRRHLRGVSASESKAELEVELERRFREMVLVVDGRYRRVSGLSLADMCRPRT